MRARSILLFACASAGVLAASACNLIFSIEPGEPTGGGGSSPDGGSPGGGGTGGATGSTSSSTASTGSTGTGGTKPCMPNTATCEGAVLHACDENGLAKPDVTCEAVAACDAPAGACNEVADLPRLGVGVGRACAIEDDKSVRCWGVNNGGILVPGDKHLTVPSAAPVPGVMGARRIAVGSGQVCIVKDDGSVMCWGATDAGETGVAPGGATGPATLAMPGGLTALEVGAAHRCTCARLADGAVACWGQRDTGCFGDLSQAQTVSFTPEVIPGVTGAVQIEVDTYASPTCARLASGKVKCWGINSAPKELANIDDAVDIAVARGTVVVRSASKGLVFSTPMPGGFTDPAQYGVAGTLTSIAGGDSFCALRADNTLSCAIVEGPPPPANPTLVPGLPSGKIVEIAAGYSLSYGEGLQCLRLEGTPIASRVHCWGDDYGHALGAGAPSSVRTPQTVPSVGGVQRLSSSHSSTTAVLSSGGVVAWGLTSSLPGSSAPTPKTISALGTDNDAVHTQDVERLGYIVKKTGSLALFEAGSPVSGKRLLKVGGTNFIEARNYGRFDIALTTAGLVVYGDAVDSNDSGIFGNGTNTATADTFAAVPGLTNVSAFAAYGFDYGVVPAHACAILSSPSGAVRCWGTNENGQVGTGSTSTSVNAPAAVTIPNSETAISVAAGIRFSCVATGAGSVYCWGRNDSGVLGLPTGTPEVPFPTKIQGIDNAMGVTAREAHVCAWLADNTVKCWGANYDGQLGDGSFEDTYTPVAVTGLQSVADVSAGQSHTCARHLNGDVSCWGSTYNGQVGTGVVGVFDAPRMVLGL